jgi:hypothetical protein
VLLGLLALSFVCFLFTIVHFLCIVIDTMLTACDLESVLVDMSLLFSTGFEGPSLITAKYDALLTMWGLAETWQGYMVNEPFGALVG